MALSALCEDSEWGRAWRDILQTRFSTLGPLDGHAVGNLLIAGLWQRTGDVVEGLDWVARLLRAQGRVLPLAEEPLQISASGSTRPCARNKRATQSSPSTTSPVRSHTPAISRLPKECPSSGPRVENRVCNTSRQPRPHSLSSHNALSAMRRSPGGTMPISSRSLPEEPPSVSYTHLTLPTNREV